MDTPERPENVSLRLTGRYVEQNNKEPFSQIDSYYSRRAMWPFAWARTQF